MQSEHCEQLKLASSSHNGARLPSETVAQQSGLRRLVHNRRIAFRCPDDLVQSVQDAADRNGVGLPEYIRDLIRREVSAS